MYAPGEYDLAGFAVGVVEKRRASSTAARSSPATRCSASRRAGRIPTASRWSARSSPPAAPTSRSPSRPPDRRTLGDALLAPTRIYVKPLLALLHELPVKGMAHITGGGLVENVPRMLPAGLQARLDRARGRGPPIFDWLQRHGDVADAEMHRVFNCGIGMVGGRRGRARRARAALARRGRRARVRDRRDRRRSRPANPPRSSSDASAARRTRNGAMATRITVLISGRGSNLAALLAADARRQRSAATSPRVVSQRPGRARPGARARMASRRSWSITALSDARRVRWGAGRLRSTPTPRPRRAGRVHARAGRAFVRALCGPAHQRPSVAAAAVSRPAHASAGVGGRARIHGCTVHFVTPDVDVGPIIAQAAVPVLDDDDEASLAARVLAQEHMLLPAAVRWFCEGRLVIEGRRVRVNGFRKPRSPARSAFRRA